MVLTVGLLVGTAAFSLTPPSSCLAAARTERGLHTVCRSGLLVMELQPSDAGYKRAKVRSFFRNLRGKGEDATDLPTAPVVEVKAPTPAPAPAPPPQPAP